MIANKKSYILILLLGLALQSNAQIAKYSNEFLAIGVGARALAMGNSTVATVTDVTSTYWNPACLMQIPNNLQLGLMHNEYFAGLAKYDYLGSAFKISDSSTFGISIIHFGIDDIPNTLELIDKDGNIRYDKISSFSDAEYAIMFSYARKSSINGLSYGTSIKIIHKKVGDFAKVWGFGFDLGARYEYKKLILGANARDVTTTFNAWTFNNSDKLIEVFNLTGNEIPANSIEYTMPRLIIGAAYKIKISEKFSALPELNTDITFDGKRNVFIKSNPISIDPHIGVEIGFKNLVFLRTGIMNMQKVPNFAGKNELDFQPNIGLGLSLKRLSIDYALTDIGNQSIALYSNVFSIRYAIDKH